VTVAAVSQGFLPTLFPSLARTRLIIAISKAEMAAARQTAPLKLVNFAKSPAPPNGDQSHEFSATMLPHLDSAYSFARYLTRGDAAAEDLVHDAYIRALRAFPSFRGGDAKAWILTIVRNCFLTWAKARNSAKTITDDHAIETAADETTPEQDLARAQQSTIMRRLIAELPPQLAEAIVLREIEDLSYREIAAAIDAPIGTVMSRLARAREQLAAAWLAESEASS
jgi:RNA polymerase sigma-70 factor (ECF subfamily)